MFLMKSSPQPLPTTPDVPPPVAEALANALAHLEHATQSINNALNAYYEANPPAEKHHG